MLAFKSGARFHDVTDSPQMQSTVLKDGRALHVIDTPGFFGCSFDSDVLEEIQKLADDGIQAFLLVLSVSSRFTEEERLTFQRLKSLFGPKFTDYLILIYTGGDELEEDGDTLEGYLGNNRPAPLKDAQDRVVLFDNKAKDGAKKEAQLQKLLHLIDKVTDANGGKPYLCKLKEAGGQEEDSKSIQSCVEGTVSRRNVAWARQQLGLQTGLGAIILDAEREKTGADATEEES